MNITILGSGVVGVTTAYYLAKAGHEVTVLDRQPGPALETSYANAGQLSYGYSTPWAGPGVPVKAAKWLMMKNRPFVMWPLPDPRLWVWMAKMLRNCTTERFEINKSRMLRLAEYSHRCFADLRAETGIQYDGREQGTLQVFRSQKQVESIQKDMALLRESGIAYEYLDADACVAAEPGLGPTRDKIVGGLRLPGDDTGDCQMFTQKLAALAEALGVTFHYGVEIKGLETTGNRVTRVVTGRGDFRADQVVAAMGSYTPFLLKPLGLRLPVYPVKGYSLTLPIVDEAKAPVSTVMDETYKIAITRFENRIRVGGTAELAGFSLSLREPRRRTLEFSVHDLFPHAGDLSQALFWTGLRPMTPDGTPIIGATGYGNLWTNTGHGTLGWTMSCGSGRLLADLISGRAPEIQADDLAYGRYR